MMISYDTAGEIIHPQLFTRLSCRYVVTDQLSSLHRSPHLSAPISGTELSMRLPRDSVGLFPELLASFEGTVCNDDNENDEDDDDDDDDLLLTYLLTDLPTYLLIC